MKKQHGFTLIELLVVIAVIGILAGVILVSLNSARVKARDARRVSDMKQYSIALELYYSTYGAYPVGSSGSDRTGWVLDQGYSSQHALGALKDAGLMKSLPVDPGKNNYLNYGVITGCGSAEMYGYWSDGQRYLLGAVQEARGTTGCTQVGNWGGPTYADHTFQYYIRQGV